MPIVESSETTASGDSSGIADYHGDGSETLAAAQDLIWDPDRDPSDCIELARQALTAYARPDVTAERWWAGLEPFLTPAAQQAYLYTDPRNVPVRRIVGEPTIVDPGGSDLVVIAHVPTDDGQYAVTMSRTPQRPDWRVERIRPPERHVGD